MYSNFPIIFVKFLLSPFQDNSMSGHRLHLKSHLSPIIVESMGFRYIKRLKFPEWTMATHSSRLLHMVFLRSWVAFSLVNIISNFLLHSYKVLLENSCWALSEYSSPNAIRLQHNMYNTIMTVITVFGFLPVASTKLNSLKSEF